MEAEGVLKKNVNAMQWQIVKDTTTLLEPFMTAQQLLEGESYVTISMIAFMVWKIQKDLVIAITSETSSQHVQELARKMYTCFEDSGVVGIQVLWPFSIKQRDHKGAPRVSQGWL
jgi:threonine dehydratase